MQLTKRLRSLDETKRRPRSQSRGIVLALGGIGVVPTRAGAETGPVPERVPPQQHQCTEEEAEEAEEASAADERAFLGLGPTFTEQSSQKT